MATDFKLPPLGENISSGDVVSVLVNEGDEIQVNKGVREIETDKAVVEVPSSTAGKVSKIYVRKGQTVKIGDPLISIEAGAAAESKPAAAEPAAKAPDPKPAEKKPETASAAKAPSKAAEPAPASSNGGA